jgi:hypothetical protein
MVSDEVKEELHLVVEVVHETSGVMASGAKRSSSSDAPWTGGGRSLTASLSQW